jgi:hypothetical protein
MVFIATVRDRICGSRSGSRLSASHDGLGLCPADQQGQPTELVNQVSAKSTLDAEAPAPMRQMPAHTREHGLTKLMFFRFLSRLPELPVRVDLNRIR